MTPRLGRGLRLVIVVAVVAGLVLFARNVEWRATWHAVRDASPALLAVAAITNVISVVLKGVRWWIFLRPLGATPGAIPFRLALRATFLGAGFNNLLVANSGEAARVLCVAQSAGVAGERVLATLALERLFELMGYIMLLAMAASFLPLPAAIAEMRIVAFGALVSITALLVYLARHPEKADLPTLDVQGFAGRARAYGSNFFRTLTAVSTGPRFAAALTLSVAAWALQVATYHLTAVAAHFPITVVGTTAALLAANLGFAIRATPGNVGLFQMMYAMTAVAFGMNKDIATGVALLIQTQQILPVTLLGLIMAPGLLTRPAAESTATS